MNKSDKELCEKFGTTANEIESSAELYERGDLNGMRFGAPINGRPQSKMCSTSFQLYDFELAAIDRAAKIEGISFSAFVRRACCNELASKDRFNRDGGADEELDDIPSEVDFSNATPNPYVGKARRRVEININNEALEYFKGEAERTGISYQALINLALSQCANDQQHLSFS